MWHGPPSQASWGSRYAHAMTKSRTLVLLAGLWALPACEGRLGTTREDASGLDARASDAGGLDGGGFDVPPGDAAPASDVPEPSVDAGPCGATLAGSLTFTELTGVGGGAQAAPTPSGGVLVAWTGSGTISLQRFDGGGAPFGSGASTAGDGLWGVAASADRNAVLVSRGDELLLVVFPSAGGVGAETRLMGANDHGVTNNEWFGDLLRAGRLDWNGSEWIAYATVQRLWPDGIAHYGDTLRHFTPSGAPATVEWGWGCSHSMEVRLTHDASGGVGPVCSSDCYPAKGVFFRHDTTVHLDPSGNCAGYVEQRLGGVASVGSAFLIGFTSRAGTPGSIDPGVVVAGSSTSPVTWLSTDAGDAREMHLGAFEGAGIAAWIEGASAHLVRVAASGAPMGSPETLPSSDLSGAGDFFSYADGSVGWLVNTRLARLRACR